MIKPLQIKSPTLLLILQVLWEPCALNLSFILVEILNRW